MSYPDDADGDALRRVAQDADMSKPMEIDFFVEVPSETAGHEVSKLATARGYKTALRCDDGKWTCDCSKTMLATYDAVCGSQRELDELSAPFGGRSDGWGSFGNLQ